jgi:hypothetical protein
MENPWLALPKSAPFVLAGDLDAVSALNLWSKERAKTDDDFEAYRIRTGLLPDPFIGDPEAPVVFVMANPGYTDEARAARWGCGSDDSWHHKQFFRELYYENYAQRPLEYPMFFLDPRVEESPAGHWCRRRFLGRLRLIFDDRTLARSIALVDFFPYHSAKYRFVPKFSVPSQAYSQELIASAVARGATIVLMRAVARLLEFIPALQAFDYLVSVSPQNPAVSPGNIRTRDGKENGFERIVERIRSSGR